MTMPRVLVTSGVPMDGFALPSDFEVVYPGEGKSFTREEMLALLLKADAVLACSALDAELIQAGTHLKLIVCYGAGYDSIDVSAATALGVPVANTPDSVTEATAELAFSMILCLARRLCEMNRQMHGEAAATAFGMGKQMGASVRGKTLGIVGMGRIGARVADFGRCMGMRIIYHARSAKPEQERLGAVRCSLTELMAEADIVSLHCPLTPETDGMITRALLTSMKPTAYLVNTARGRVIDEDALLELLKEKRIAGAGIDVFIGEPSIRPEWATLENVLLTPHIGSNTAEARREMMVAARDRIVDALAGRRPQNLVNGEVWQTGLL